MKVSQRLASFCERHGIHLDRAHSSEGIVVLKNVPVNAAALTKPRTNLCAARNPETRKYVVWVDQDLHCRVPGCPAESLLSGSVKDDWQLVNHPQPFDSPESAIMETVRTLTQPVTPLNAAAACRQLGGKLLPEVAMPVDLAAYRMPILCRDRVLDTAVRLLRHGGQMVVLAGPCGSGLTGCAVEVLSRAFQGRPPQVVRVDGRLVGTEMLYPASTDERMRQLMTDCAADAGTWYVFDNLQWLLRSGLLVQNALSSGLERGLKLIGTFQLDCVRTNRVMPPLARKFHWIELPPLDRDELAEILFDRAAWLAEQRGIEFTVESISTAILQSQSLPCGDPGRCISLLEAAAALVDDGCRIGPDEVFAARSMFLTEDADFR